MQGSSWRSIRHFTAAVALTALCGCSDEKEETGSPESVSDFRYILNTVVDDPDGNRSTYVQVIRSLEGDFTNAAGIELPGYGTMIADSKSFYVGLSEEPTWVRYGLDSAGAIVETGRLSLLNYGMSYIDYGNSMVDEETAVSVLSEPTVAVVWNPKTMQIKGEIDLNHLQRAGYSLEVWNTSVHDGLVYIPGRWGNWDDEKILPGVSMTIVDPKAMTLVGVAEDDRCTSAGAMVFDAAGYGYALGDGRNYMDHAYAAAHGQPTPKPTCILRIPPGGTDFEQSFYHSVPSLTGGRDAISELDDARPRSGLAFSLIFHPEKLPAGMTANSFDFWNEPAHKMWRIKLGDTPIAEEVQGFPFTQLGFEAAALDGKLYVGQTDDGVRAQVYEIDPDTNTATKKFTTEGYFNALFRLTP